MSASSDYPEFVARFYDTVYAELRTGIDHEFFLGEMLAAPGPVLEIGAGTGRFFVEALRRGVDVHGIDASPAMLGRLREKIDPAEHGRVALQDVRQLRLGRRFELVVAPFRVFQHLLEIDDQLAALERVHDHLADGGRFLFDVFLPDLGKLAAGMPECVDFDGEHAPGKRLRRTTSTRHDYPRQRLLGTMRFDWDENGPRSASWEFEMRYFFRYELEHLIHRSPLRLDAIHGDYALGPIREGSTDLVVACRRDPARGSAC